MAKPIPNVEQLQSEICEWISGGKSLAAWCRQGKASYSQVLRWLNDDENFRSNYARAREDMADADADKINDISERVIAGELDPQAARVAIDALKWSAGKRKPKKYGDKLDVEANMTSEIKIVIGGNA